MKASKNTKLKKTMGNRVVISLSLALAFVALLGLLRSAEAGVVVRASVVTPTVRVTVSNGPAVHPPLQAGCVVAAPVRLVTHERRPRPRTRVIRNERANIRRLSQEDRAIARRLQHMTGIKKDVLLSYRRTGWTWPEIAFELRIRRTDLAVAMNPQGKHLAHAGMESCTYQLNHR